MVQNQGVPIASLLKEISSGDSIAQAHTLPLHLPQATSILMAGLWHTKASARDLLHAILYPQVLLVVND